MRVKKYIGAYLAEMNGADAILFAGGIGENSAAIRARIASGMEWCGLTLDEERNRATVGTVGEIRADGSKLRAYVIPTDEELLIARDTARLVLHADVPG
jgi:acetate kinase